MVQLEFGQGDFFEELSVGVVVSELQSRTIERVNTAACRILGRGNPELCGLTWHSLVLRADWEKLPETSREIIDLDSTAPAAVVRLTRPDGRLVHSLITTTAKTIGKRRMLLSQIQDVSDRERARRRLQLVLDHSPVALVLVDRSGRVLARDGFTVEENVEGLRAAEESSVFEAFAEQEAGLAVVRRALGGEAVSQVVESFGMYVDMHAIPIPDADGAVSSVALVATDVTARERAHADQAALGDLAQRALDTVEPGSLWRYAAGVLADRLNATVTVDDVDPQNEGANLATAPGPIPTAAAPRDVTERALATRGTDAVGTDAGGTDAGGTDTGGTDTGGTDTVRRWTAPGWSAMAAPVGRPGEPAAVVTVRRPNDLARSRARSSPPVRHVPPPGPFTDDEANFLRAAGSVLGSAALRFAMEREILHRSLHDPLTDLPNRAALIDQLDRALQSGRYDHGRTGVVFVDLDGFKSVNDAYGHRAGDRLLREVAARLRGSVRPTDVVARLSGDEFAVLCHPVESHDEVEPVARRALAALAAPVDLGGVEFAVTASAGVALSGTDLADPERLLDAADMAMYAAKRAGAGGSVRYEASMRPEMEPPGDARDRANRRRRDSRLNPPRRSDAGPPPHGGRRR